MAYNGWKNYETWATKLWMDCTYGECIYWRESAQELANQHGPESEDKGRYELAEMMKEIYEDSIPDLGTNIYSDLLDYALSRVDWYEIAENYYSDVTYENIEDEDEDVFERLIREEEEETEEATNGKAGA